MEGTRKIHEAGWLQIGMTIGQFSRPFHKEIGRGVQKINRNCIPVIVTPPVELFIRSLRTLTKERRLTQGSAHQAHMGKVKYRFISGIL